MYVYIYIYLILYYIVWYSIIIYYQLRSFVLGPFGDVKYLVPGGEKGRGYYATRSREVAARIDWESCRSCQPRKRTLIAKSETPFQTSLLKLLWHQFLPGVFQQESFSYERSQHSADLVDDCSSALVLRRAIIIVKKITIGWYHDPPRCPFQLTLWPLWWFALLCVPGAMYLWCRRGGCRCAFGSPRPQCWRGRIRTQKFLWRCNWCSRCWCRDLGQVVTLFCDLPSLKRLKRPSLRCRGLSLACGCSWMFQGDWDSMTRYERFHILCLQSSECSRTKLQMRWGTWQLWSSHSERLEDLWSFEAVPKARSSTEQRLPDVRCRRVSSLVVGRWSHEDCVWIMSRLCLMMFDDWWIRWSEDMLKLCLLNSYCCSILMRLRVGGPQDYWMPDSLVLGASLVCDLVDTGSKLKHHFCFEGAVVSLLAGCYLVHLLCFH